MQFADISDIQVAEDRQRQDFNPRAQEDLEDSIAKNGLFHAIICRKQGDKLFLVAGERRLRAINALYREGKIFNYNAALVEPRKIPYALIDSDADEVRIKEIELEENIIRQDLTWQERTQALNELHELRKSQNPGQTLTATAQEVAAKRMGTRDQTQSRNEKAMSDSIARAGVIARMMEDPEVANARNERDAFNIASRRLEADWLDRMAKMRPQASGSDAASHTLIHDDCIKALSRLDAESFDLIIADPPYGMGADDFGSAAKFSHRYDDSPETSAAICQAIAKEGYRVSKPQAHMFLFCDIESFTSLRKMCEAAGWTVFRTPVIWDKSSSGHAPVGTRGFRRRYELILFASKGKKPLARLQDDIIPIANLRDKYYAAQKPPALYEFLVNLSCIRGDSILDPCCGAGTIFRAARSAGVKATGIEADAEAVKLCRIAMEEIEE